MKPTYIDTQLLTKTGPRAACIELSDLTNAPAGFPTYVSVVRPDGKSFTFRRSSVFHTGSGEDLEVGGYDYIGPKGCTITIFND